MPYPDIVGAIVCAPCELCVVFVSIDNRGLFVARVEGDSWCMLELDVDRKSCEAGDFLRRLNGSRLVFIPKEEDDTCMLQEDVCEREGNVKEQAGTTAVYIDRHAVDPCTCSNS